MFRPFHALMSCLLAFALVLWQQAPGLAQTPGSPAPAASPGPAATAPVQIRSYVLDYGDSLNLVVVGNEQLKIEQQPIRPDGRISLPLLGEVQAGGLTVPQFSDRVTKAYTKFFVDPKIVVNVAKFRPLQISVVGKVEKPGTFPVTEPIRLLPAIALAGGLNERSNPNNVQVLRANGERHVINLMEVLSGNMEGNLMLYDGDTVTIEETPNPDWYRLLPPIASSLSILSTIVILLVRR
ncbi:Polysialic acid transport protein KpsD precursor [compost metagenome]